MKEEIIVCSNNMNKDLIDCVEALADEIINDINTTTNTEYIIEMLDGFLWREEYILDDLSEAIKEMNKLKSSLPRNQFRIIKCQWEVVK